MGKITGQEKREQLPEKVLLLYEAVLRLMKDGADVQGMKVADITDAAGIGKGTAYDYFDSKEEIIVYALLFFAEEFMEKLARGIEARPTFKARVEYALNPVDIHKEEGVCILRVVNLLFEPSQTGQLLRERVHERKKRGNCPPLLVSRRVVEEGIAAGEIRSDLPVGYLSYSLITKFVSYYAIAADILNQDGKPMLFDSGEMTKEEFHRCTINGILEEFQYSSRCASAFV